MSYQVVCLADHPDLVDQCVDLLNAQWPRSKTARLRSLHQPTGMTFPTSLLLLTDNHGVKRVVGHSKIIPVPYNETACFVESVVIDSGMRRQGLGRRIMEKTEDFVKSKGVKTIHLTTHDQQEFYAKLGYNLGDPVVVYGGISCNLHKLTENHRTVAGNKHLPIGTTTADNHVTKPNGNNNGTCSPQSQPVPLPPPPPPTMPMRADADRPTKVFMVKHL